MRLVAITAAVVVAGGAFAAEVAPTEVSYGEYGAVETSLSGTPGNAEEGALIAGDKSRGNCVACHQISALEDVPFQGEVGPPLDGAADRWEEADLRGIVANAKMTFPESVMPAFYKTVGFTRPGDAYTGKAAPDDLPPILSAQEIEDVVAFLMTLKYE
ncbi:Cytochrome c [Roseivivax sp. THAF40]|uniref:sulfur oxidation c-type cytochrome SoxX n=1 Tax=unclassified Roseivivax TaxID=2639302 RepID=UPI00126925EE|nr:MULTISPECIES: sulfur oxidation c-type cytochrome SoxX [unclassified Roseivivax]QFS83831.1 Cytochrome c [Roseivivax sp. THAF197b]QFT47663.1 Cytochrome c [Roseivivax sp. THAF40]